MGALTIAVTGAGGFLGRAVVAAARARGHDVRALLRGDVPPEWNGIAVTRADLAAPGALSAVAEAFEGAGAVIHCAARVSGDDAAHARDTLAATDTVLAAMARARAPRLVLASSLSVYGYGGLRPGAVLDEDTPLEPRPGLRDAYCRAKLAQEALCSAAAEREGFGLWLMRIGALWEEGRLWNDHLGLARGATLFSAGRGGDVPLAHVATAAEALVRAAEAEPRRPAEALNVVDSALPDRGAVIDALRAQGWPRRVLPLPWGALVAAGRVVPGLARRGPGLLRAEVARARLMPLRYPNDRLRDRLGWTPPARFAERESQG